MLKEIIRSSLAPKAIGTYSPAIKVNNTIYVSGQIGLNPETMEMVVGIENQIHQVLANLQAVVEASSATLDNVIKLNIYLTDISNFALINNLMPQYFNEPYPARTLIGVKELPKNALVEADCIVVL